MYYKEEVIEGILCYKLFPTDEWKKVGEKDLTKRYMELKAKVAELEMQLEMKMQCDE